MLVNLALALIFIAAFVWTSREATRERLSLIEAAQKERDRLREEFATERVHWNQERESLLTRIQAPQIGIATTGDPGKQFVGFDDDKDYWQAADERDGLVV